MASQDLKSEDEAAASNVPYGLRVTLQHLISEAGKAGVPLMTYQLSSNAQPAVQNLLKAAVGLTKLQDVGLGKSQSAVVLSCKA